MTGVKTPKPAFPAEAASKDYAAALDAADPLKDCRDEFIIPSKANLASKKLAKPGKASLEEQRVRRMYLTNSFRPLKRAEYLFLRQLTGHPAQSCFQVHGGTARHMVVHRCLWTLH